MQNESLNAPTAEVYAFKKAFKKFSQKRKMADHRSSFRLPGCFVETATPIIIRIHRFSNILGISLIFSFTRLKKTKLTYTAISLELKSLRK